MANFTYNVCKKNLMEGTLDLTTTGRVKALLVMSNTTADTEKGKLFLSQFTTLDECDGTNYARQTLTGMTVTQDDVDDEGVFDATNVTFTVEDDASRTIAGVIIYFDLIGGDNDVTNVPLYWIEDSTPITANGGDIVVSFAAEGIANNVDA